MTYIVTQNVDYLAFTLKSPRIVFSDKGYQNIKSPNSRYDMCEQAVSGGLHMWHSRHERMGHHYVYAGQALAYIRQLGFDEAEIVKWCLEKSSISRIDIAITSQPDSEIAKHGFTPHALAWAVRDDMLKSRLKPSKDITNGMKTETKYIGNPTTRARLFRAYDKGVDSGLVPNFLIRYEMETRKGTKTIARAVVDREPYGAIIRRYIDFPTQRTWLEIMNAKPATMKHETPVLSAVEMAEHKSDSRWQWLIDSIPRTIEKALLDDFKRTGIKPADNPKFHEFISRVMNKTGV